MKDELVLVPKEPTPEMIDAGGRQIACDTQGFGPASMTLGHYSSPKIEAENRERAESAYRAMIKAYSEKVTTMITTNLPCEHTWVYEGHGHNYSVYRCLNCHITEER